MLNVLIAAVLWGSSGVCAQFIMQESQMSSPFLTMTRLLFAGLILLMLGFVHGDRIFRVLQNRRDALSLLFFSLFGALTVQFTFLMTIEKSNAATATVLQFLSRRSSSPGSPSPAKRVPLRWCWELSAPRWRAPFCW
ncbi:inner membrane transporter yicL [Klebsiella variicola]|uniref:Inner membrane transporter yicL n=1 Tax=Klebsiella variicola TaxID=244366 RepID=A0A7H4MA06_KLEVA|nr:inner membrane transporter yicL [Klebsiella variicola]